MRSLGIDPFFRILLEIVRHSVGWGVQGVPRQMMREIAVRHKTASVEEFL